MKKKILYNLDLFIPGSDWVRINESKKDTVDYPKFSSPLKIKETKWGAGMPWDSFGTLVSNANAVNKNNESVYFINGGTTENVGKLFIDKNNIISGCVIFSSRRLISGQYSNYLNWTDEYLAPNESHPKFEQFKYDSLVYSLFESKSNQSSLRQVEYKNQLWDIKNEFFWLY